MELAEARGKAPVVYGASARHTSCGTLYRHSRGQVRGWKGVYTSRGAEDTTLWRR
jgi:hypothetical protein